MIKNYGETGRAFNTRKKKSIWETPKLRPNVLELLIMPGPTTTPLTLKTRQLLTKALLEQEKILEAWHTRVTPNADNNSCPLPGQYKHSF